MSDERKPMTQEEQAAIQGRLNAITQPPWKNCNSTYYGMVKAGEKEVAVASYYNCVYEDCRVTREDQAANAEFIANAPTDISRLLAEVERLNKVSRYLAENLVRQTSNRKKYVGAEDAWGLGFQLYKTREEAIQSWIDKAERETNNAE